MSSRMLWVHLRLSSANVESRQTGGWIFCSCIYLFIYLLILEITHSNDSKDCSLRHYPRVQSPPVWHIFNNRYFCSTVVFFLYFVFLRSTAALLASCFKKLAHSTPKFHQEWKTYPRLETTIRCNHPLWPFIKFAFTDLCCFTSAWFAVMVDPFGLTAMLMRQLKFFALASLRGDQFCPLASGGRSQHSLFPA